MKETVDIAGVQVNTYSFSDSLDRIKLFVADTDETNQVVTPNPEMIVESRSNESFRNVLNNADLSIADGVGLLIAAELLSTTIPNVPILREVLVLLHAVRLGIKGVLGRKFSVITERVSGSDVVQAVLDGQVGDVSIFLLGGFDATAQKASEIITNTYPGTSVVGYHAGGTVSVDGIGSDDDEVTSVINSVNPDVLLVAFGAPKQDLWIARNKDKINARVAIGVGGTLDFLAGVQKRAPVFFRRLNLEWLWRLVTEPRRFKRIGKAVITFPLYVSQYKLYMVKSGHGATFERFYS